MLYKIKERKCLLRRLFIILTLLFVPLFIALRSVNVSALGTYTFGLRYRTNNGNYQYAGDLRFGRSDGVTIVYGGANRYNFYTSTVTPTGSFAVIHFETNIVISTDDIQYVFGYWDNLADLSIENVYFDDVDYTSNIVTSSVSTAITDWDQWLNGVHYYNSTLTVYGDVVVNNIPTGSDERFRIIVGSENDFYVNNTDNPDLFYFEQNPMSIDFTQDINNALLQTQINQNNTIINNNQQYYDANYEAVDNINKQSTSDINNSTSSQTTSIIGVISSFVSALSSVQTGSCELTLPFPQLIGGNQVVNPCSGKEKAPAMITVSSSLFLIGIFIPFAFIVLKMIYNEIRSFTNG